MDFLVAFLGKAWLALRILITILILFVPVFDTVISAVHDLSFFLFHEGINTLASRV